MAFEWVVFGLLLLVINSMSDQSRAKYFKATGLKGPAYLAFGIGAYLAARTIDLPNTGFVSLDLVVARLPFYVLAIILVIRAFKGPKVTTKRKSAKR